MILTLLIIVAVFVANVANLISVDPKLTDDETKKYDVPIHNVTMSNRFEHLIWFLQVKKNTKIHTDPNDAHLQISDIHISIFQDHTRITELREFCDLTLDTIQPSVVIASGDLTDAKTKDHIGSRQYETEWMFYRNILNECRVTEKTQWLDVRGNHGNKNFNDFN